MDIEERLRDKLSEISAILGTKAYENKEIGVLSGVSGIALFQFYYSKLLDDDTYAEIGAETITEAIELINKGFSYPTFCTGIAGACWVLELLKEEGFIALEDDFLSAELDVFLLEVMKSDIQEENYDFLHGAMGYGFYFFKRYQNTTSEHLKDKYKVYISKLIKALRHSSISCDQGVWWKSVLSEEKNLVGCNLGLSHGVSSIINFLSRLVVYEDFYEEAHKLLSHTVAYILSCKNIDKSCVSSFPNWFVYKGEINANSRLAWCYGDLGIGISLLRAGEVLKDDYLYNEAIAILKHSTKRRDIEEAGIVDAGLCHGAYGVFHIYSYLYKKTKIEIFKETSVFWAQQALDMGVHKNGFAGYLVFKGTEKEKYKPEVNLLEGIAGIGLAIISHLAPFDTKWDECLLIS